MPPLYISFIIFLPDMSESVRSSYATQSTLSLLENLRYSNDHDDNAQPLIPLCTSLDGTVMDQSPSADDGPQPLVSFDLPAAAQPAMIIDRTSDDYSSPQPLKSECTSYSLVSASSDESSAGAAVQTQGKPLTVQRG